MSILGQVKVPAVGPVSNEMEATSMVGGFNPSKDNFDSYLTKLQTICTETMSNEEVKPSTGSSGIQGTEPPWERPTTFI